MHVAHVVLVLATLVAWALAGEASAATVTSSDDTRPRVVVYGDSLVVQSELALTAVGAAFDLDVAARAFGGAAPCDALAWLADDLRHSVPDMVVFAFSGNSLSECMRLGNGRLASGRDLVAKYRADLESVINMTTHAGAPLVLGSPPASRDHRRSWHRLDSLYRDLSDDHRPYVHYTDAGVGIAPDGRYRDAQACLTFERRLALGACGSDGENQVRAPDGVHFCATTGAAAAVQPCKGYSSGVVRYALALLGTPRTELAALADPERTDLDRIRR